MMQRERHGLPRSVVKAIRTLLDKGRVQHEIADLYGISRECVSSIATQRVYKTRVSDGDDDAA
jgi:predicted transcriptional regulator